MTRLVARVAALWRYPVKSMLGEMLEASDLTDRGLAGDRVFALADEETGKIVSAKNPRKWGGMFGFRATLLNDPSGSQPAVAEITFPDGSRSRSDDDSLDRRLGEVLGRKVRLTSASGRAPTLEEYWPDMGELRHRDVVTDEAMPPGTFFDAAPVHVLTKSTLEHLRRAYPQGRFEPERFRPNILLDAGEGGFVENGWIGSTLSVGHDVLLRIVGPCGRCVMTTLPQGALPKDPGILRTAALHNDVKVGVYAEVERPGRIRMNDPVASS